MRLITPVQAAEQLQISRDTVYTLIRTKELPSAKIRGQYRIREADLEAYVRQVMSGSVYPETLP